ncbi:MAG: vWA domain-containing protein [Polyangiaceae bacterium]
MKLLFFPTSVFVLTAILAGCGAGHDPNSGGAGGDANGGSGNSGNSHNSGGTGSGFGGEGAGFSSGGSTGQGGECAGDEYGAEKVPLDIYIMLDQSGSMGDPDSNGAVKWDSCASAIGQFVNQPAAAGIGVGIQYFPVPNGVSCPTFPVQCSSDNDCQAGCGPCDIPPGFPFGFCSGVGDADSCSVVDYATPDVEIGSLPANATAITNSIGNHGPTGGTPTSAALQGAIDHAKAWATVNPGHVAVVVLATDGDPSSCVTDLPAINAIAAAGANGTPKVLTFVIGVGGSQSALDGFASNGGTGQAFMIDQDPNVQDAFLNALNVIQGQALPCSYLIPIPEQGQTLDPNKVNVYYTPSGGTREVIPRVDGAANCPANGLAWFYDSPTNPTQIMLCSSTCSTLTADTGGTVKVVVGCDTVVQ